jgi:hypothetical protein
VEGASPGQDLNQQINQREGRRKLGTVTSPAAGECDSFRPESRLKARGEASTRESFEPNRRRHPKVGFESHVAWQGPGSERGVRARSLSVPPQAATSSDIEIRRSRHGFRVAEVVGTKRTEGL